MKCKECYSENDHVTPLLHPMDCLKEHTQYICGTCGRCICIEHDPKRNLQRWNFPFKSLDIAMLYLRTAEYTMKKTCGIYKIDTGKRITYKIFADEDAALQYQKTHTSYSCVCVFQNPRYQELNHTEVRKLTMEEINVYMQKRNAHI